MIAYQGFGRSTERDRRFIMIRRVATLGYGVVAYLAFVAVFAYTIGFVAGIGVPQTGEMHISWMCSSLM